ncbi:methyltransferase [Rheinheimera texasensis]|uniref:tRNA1(Val) (adenine(37)-N6)-methyltransferase n=1 Tax=Rheinheimera texasensis TaxID=306205 RepID=UPI0032B28C8A
MAAGFRCKQFFVSHQHCAMKVGTDALLLGAWTSVPASGDCLDIGCGSGILSLMLAQRTGSLQLIDAVELGSAAAAQARQNVLESPWPSRIRVIERDILTYPGSADHLAQRRYQQITSNPPYFTAALTNPDQQKQLARHNDQLPFAGLLQVAAALLVPNGRFSLILPVQEAERLLGLARDSAWHLLRSQAVQSQPDKSPARLLLELGLAPVATEQLPVLLVRDEQGQYSPAYRRLLAGFYLNF